MTVIDAPVAPQAAPVVAQLLEAAPSLPVHDLYLSSWGAQVYDGITKGDTGEVHELLRLLRGPACDVLELACGSGRLTLPMLTRGHRVTAMDNAQPMLDALAERLSAGRAAPLTARLEVRLGDMSSFVLERTFDVVVLGATSVTLLDAEQRASMLRAAHAHLRPGGRLLVTAVDVDAWDAGASDRTSATLLHLDGQPVLCLLVEHRDAVTGLRHVSVLTQRVGPQGLSDPQVVLSTPRLVAASTLADEAVAAGFSTPVSHPCAKTGTGPVVMLECTR